MSRPPSLDKSFSFVVLYIPSGVPVLMPACSAPATLEVVHIWSYNIVSRLFENPKLEVVIDTSDAVAPSFSALREGVWKSTCKLRGVLTLAKNMVRPRVG